MDKMGIVDGGPTTQPQYRNDPWLPLGYGEVGDNCEAVSSASLPLGDAGDLGPRVWSPSAAAAGHNPCIPVPSGEVYYNASTDKAIYVANVGDTFMVDVSTFSAMPRTSWQLDAVGRTPTQATDAAGG